MTTISRKGAEIEIAGNLPQTGSEAPPFTLAATDLSDCSLSDFSGRKVILNIFPSIDTPTCAKSVRNFNERAAGFDNTVVLCISPDLPFAHQRFCEVENIKNVIPLSTFRTPEFGQQYGLTMTTTPRRGLLARAVVVVDETSTIRYTELVADISQEPDYDSAIAAI